MLIKTIEEVRAVLPVNLSFTFDNFRPDLLRAEENEVENLLGAALYADILAKYDAATLNAQETKLLGYCQRISCNLAYVTAIPKLQVQTSNQGIHIVSTERQKTAFQWQVRELKEEHINAAYEAVEKAMDFLTANIIDFPLWANSNSYTIITGTYVQNIKELEALVSIRTSYRLFREIIPQIKKADADIKRLIGAAVLTPEGLESAKRYVAYMAVSKVRGLGIDNGGLFLRAEASADMEAKKSPTADEAAIFQEGMKAEAEAEKAKIQTELNPATGGIYENGDTKYFAI